MIGLSRRCRLVCSLGHSLFHRSVVTASRIKVELDLLDEFSHSITVSFSAGNIFLKTKMEVWIELQAKLNPDRYVWLNPQWAQVESIKCVAF